MLLERSRVKIADNSGAVEVMLFAVNGKNNRQSVGVGEIVTGSVKKASPGGKVKKGDVVRVLIVRTKKHIQRKDGSVISFSDNAAVVINKATGQMVATRIFGPIAREIRANEKFKKIVSLADEVI